MRSWLYRAGGEASGDVAVGGHAQVARRTPAGGDLVHLGEFCAAAARLTLQAFGFAGPAFAVGFAVRAIRLSRISASRGRWAGSGRSSGQRMQACSWMQRVP